jgi:hypothetical protein
MRGSTHEAGSDRIFRDFLSGIPRPISSSRLEEVQTSVARRDKLRGHGNDGGDGEPRVGIAESNQSKEEEIGNTNRH